MNNKNVLILCFITSIIGIIVLFLLYLNLPVKLIKISEINNGFLNLKVKIVGEVVKISNYKAGFQILNVRDNSGDIDVLVDKEKIISLSKTDKIMVIGRVSEYKNNLQINAEKINKLSLGE